MRLVLDREPAFRLDLVGDGPLRADVEAVDRAPAPRRCGSRARNAWTMCGRCWVRRASSCCPRPAKGVSLTLLEAMAAGLPIVATRVGGNPEVVAHGKTGSAGAAAAPEALADAMLWMLRQPDARERMGRAARRRVEDRFNLDRPSTHTNDVPRRSSEHAGRVRAFARQRRSDGEASCSSPRCFRRRCSRNKGAFNREMVRALAAADEVQVVAPVSWPLALPRALRRSDVGSRATHRRHRGSPSGLFLHAEGPAQRTTARFSGGRSARRSTSCCEHFEPDVVMGYWAHPDGQAAVQVARRLGVPGVVMVGGTDVLVLGHGTGPASGRFDGCSSDADAIVTVSQDLKRTVRELGDAREQDPRRPPRRRRDAASPGRASRGRAPATRHRSGRPMLLWVGHMVPVKGLDVLIDACADAAGRTPVSPVSGRRWPARPRAAAAVREAGHHGAGDVRRLRRRTRICPTGISAADLTVLPSHSEGIPTCSSSRSRPGRRLSRRASAASPEIADPAPRSPGRAGRSRRPRPTPSSMRCRRRSPLERRALPARAVSDAAHAAARGARIHGQRASTSARDRRGAGGARAGTR